jgi:hypothetical protein
MTVRPQPAVILGAAVAALGVAAVAWFALPTQQGYVALAGLVACGGLAIRRRPPARDATGRRLLPTTIVQAALAVGIAAIPVGLLGVGLVGGRSAAPVVLGIGVAGFGLGAFALYSLTWALTRRAALAATLALAAAGVGAAWLTVPAVLDQLAGRDPF